MAIYATGTTGTIGSKFSSKVTPIRVDFLEDAFPTNLPEFTCKDFLIHLGGIVGADLVASNIQRAYAINVEATVKIAKKFISESGKLFVYVSSSHIYAPSFEKLTEDSKVAPQSHYAKQKLEAEKSLQALFNRVPERLCIVRVFSILDWDVAPFTLGGGIAKLASKDEIHQLRNADDVRDFLTPQKVAESLEEIIRSQNLFGIVNLCSGEGTSVANAARAMLLKRNHEVPENRILHEKSSNPYVVGSNSKLLLAIPNLDLSWHPSP